MSMGKNFAYAMRISDLKLSVEDLYKLPRCQVIVRINCDTARY